jgi:hypothetical protein
VRGELTRPLAAVPPVSVQVPEAPLMFPSAGPRKLEVRVTANLANAAGELRLALPAGWRAEPEKQDFRLAAKGEVAAPAFLLYPPAASASGTLQATARMRDGREVVTGVKVIDYPHIPTQTLFPPARVSLVRADIRTLAKNVAYVMGAGDEMPEALRQMGCTVTLLTDEDLSGGDLNRFDAIVTGVRAYETRAGLRTNAKRLLDYVNGGGTMLAQYNTLAAAPGGAFPWGPYPFRIGRSRVTVEEAPMEYTNPQSPLLHEPNEISPKDFEGWVQERGLYFASEWDPRYLTLFRCNDPGEQPLAGGTLYVPYGKGAYVYTSLAWFRELPAGVPGAYRILANFLSAGKTLHE